jgi:hypothetical protein
MIQSINIYDRKKLKKIFFLEYFFILLQDALFKQHKILFIRTHSRQYFFHPFQYLSANNTFYYNLIFKYHIILIF